MADASDPKPGQLKSDPLLRDAPVFEGFKVLDPAVLYAQIGRGGMGAVYRGRHCKLDLDVAIKCLYPSLAAENPGYVQRFEREARLAASLTHQNVVRVMDVQQRDNLHYLVMEYVRGETAQRRVERKGALAEQEALRIMLGAAAGLAEAHGRGIVHRDIKPDNILISLEGRVKVADLGLARATEPTDGRSLSGGSMSLIMGTPQYMPPEQWDSADVGPAADVWALGATFWFLLAGQHPVEDGPPLQVARRVQDEDFPSLRAVRDDLQPEIYELIECCVARNPDERFRDAGDLLEQLRQLVVEDEAALADPEVAEEQDREGIVTPPPRETLMRIRAKLAIDGQEIVPRRRRSAGAKPSAAVRPKARPAAAAEPAPRGSSRQQAQEPGPAPSAVATPSPGGDESPSEGAATSKERSPLVWGLAGVAIALFAALLWMVVGGLGSQDGSHAREGEGDVFAATGAASDSGVRDVLETDSLYAGFSEAIDAGIEWLVAHQDADGKWDADEFDKHDTEGDPCDGHGDPAHDVGVTGLAVLALLGDGHAPGRGEHSESVERACAWLVGQMDEEGRLKMEASHNAIYCHAIGTLALCSGLAAGVTGIRDATQRAVDYLEQHRNPYKAWRYQERDGDNDLSVTGWSLLALHSGRRCGLKLNPRAFELGLKFIESVTSPDGTHGYSGIGWGSSRNHEGGHGHRFPRKFGHAMTAEGLHLRLTLGQSPAEKPILRAAAQRLLERPPSWDLAAGSADSYYWFHATRALCMLGGPQARRWCAELRSEVLFRQRRSGNYAGSWDPSDCWGEEGGRVYTTAMLVLTLESPRHGL